MKKPYVLPLILFAIFSIIYIVLEIVYSSTSGGVNNFVYLFIPAIFFEIAIFGCIIIYLINKHNNKNDDDKDN